MSKAVYGIIGYPLTQSLSPLMHNAAFKELQVEALYKLFPLKEDELDDFFLSLKDKSSMIFGFNVTVPYKEKALKYVDHLAPLAERIGAVNTIVINQKRKLIGYNTDAPGFLTHLTELNFQTSGKYIALLGAGGSARAILTALCLIPERPESIKIYNRTFTRLEKLLYELGQRVDLSIVHPVDSIDDLNLELTDLLINTTSVGMNPSDMPLIDQELLHGSMLVYDLIYNPRRTKLLKMAERAGAQTANGLGMLFYQGVLAFQHWANLELDENVKTMMRLSLEEGLRE